MLYLLDTNTCIAIMRSKPAVVNRLLEDWEQVP